MEHLWEIISWMQQIFQNKIIFRDCQFSVSILTWNFSHPEPSNTYFTKNKLEEEMKDSIYRIPSQTRACNKCLIYYLLQWKSIYFNRQWTDWRGVLIYDGIYIVPTPFREMRAKYTHTHTNCTYITEWFSYNTGHSAVPHHPLEGLHIYTI